jgi:Tfp pilus assembly protein PilF
MKNLPIKYRIILLLISSLFLVNCGGKDKELTEIAMITDSLIAKGIGFKKMSQFDSATIYADKILKIDSNNSKAFALKGEIQMSLGGNLHNDSAMFYFDKALALDSLNTTALNAKGSLLSFLGYYERANDLFDKALEVTPNQANIWHNKGFTFDNLDMSNAAIDCYNKAISIDSTYFMSWTMKGVNYLERGNAEGYDLIDKAIFINKNAWQPYCFKAKYLNRDGRNSEAFEAINNALNINKIEDAYFFKIKICMELGKEYYSEAQVCFDKLLKIIALDTSSNSMSVSFRKEVNDSLASFHKLLKK